MKRRWLDFVQGLKFVGQKGYISRKNIEKRNRSLMLLISVLSILFFIVAIPVVRDLTNIYRNAYVHTCEGGHTIWVGNYISYGTSGHYGTLMLSSDPSITTPLNPDNLNSYTQFSLTTYSFIPAAKQVAAERATANDLALIWMVEAPASGSQQFLLDSELFGSIEAVCWQYESEFGSYLNDVALTNDTLGLEMSQLIDGLGKIMTINSDNIALWEEYLDITINPTALWNGTLTLEQLNFINYLGRRGNLGPDSGIPMILQLAAIQNLPAGEPFTR